METIKLPQQFIDRMKGLLGEEWQAYYETYDQPHTQGLRVNNLKISPEEFMQVNPFVLSPIPWISGGFYYGEQDHPGRHPYHAAGLYYIQEPSAMAPAVLLDVKPGERALDLCAAPGGKASQIASALQGRGVLVANEIHPSRVKILGENLERMGVQNAVITQESPDRLAAVFESFFDKILVDAPCSGEGMFRKNPEACLEWTGDSPSLCSMRQQDILNHAAEMLKPGGSLVYSTCTFSPEENEGVLEEFLTSHPNFSLGEAKQEFPFEKAKPSWVGGRKEIQKAFRLWPHKIRGEGHFMALLHRSGTADKREINSPEKDSAEKDMVYFEEFVHQYLKEPVEGNLCLKHSHLFKVPEGMPVLDGLRVLRPGFHLGEIKKRRFEPSHALALAVKQEQAVQAINLSARGAEVIDYLRGLTLTGVDGKGWMLVTVDNYSLGWGKASEGVLKNHYPKGLRWD